MRDLLTALALALAIEGVLYALFPGGMKKMLAQIMDQPETHIRTAGLAAAVVGVALVWVIRG